MRTIVSSAYAWKTSSACMHVPLYIELVCGATDSLCVNNGDMCGGGSGLH